MIKHKLFSFEYDAWDLIDGIEFVYYDVIMTDRFGTLEKGQEFNSISVDYGTGELKVWDRKGVEPMISMKFGVHSR